MELVGKPLKEQLSTGKCNLVKIETLCKLVSVALKMSFKKEKVVKGCSNSVGTSRFDISKLNVSISSFKMSFGFKIFPFILYITK